MHSRGVALLVLVAVLCCCIADPTPPVLDRYVQGVKIYRIERPCASLGGMCVKTDKCRHRTAINNLCPEQASEGVDCCYEVIPGENVTCNEFLGECMSGCNIALQRPATDCGDEVCCLLV